MDILQTSELCPLKGYAELSGLWIMPQNQTLNNKESFSEGGKILGAQLRPVLSRNLTLNFLAMEVTEELWRLPRVLRRA